MDNANYVIPINSVKSIEINKTVNKNIVFLLKSNIIQRGILQFSCILNKAKEIYAIKLNYGIDGGTNGTFNDIYLFECDESCGVLVDNSTPILDIDENTGVVINQDIKAFHIESGKFKIKDNVLVKIKNEFKKGIIILSGKINGIFCYAVDLDLSECEDDIPQRCIVVEYDVTRLRESEDYAIVRYVLDQGDYKGIQGNLNSCYLDTSLFAIFTFNMFLDNMLLDENDNEDIEQLRDILRTEIVYPLRRTGYVDRHTVSKFRDKLQSLSPTGKFVINERDPEELFEQLFRLLTPGNYLLRTAPLRNISNIQKCFLTQLFYQSNLDKNYIDLLEMLTLTFLEFEMLIVMPPKCLILQLPRDGKDLKRFKKVTIPAKLDITRFIIASPKRCHVCSTTEVKCFFCKTCSMSQTELIYYCSDHKFNCAHDKISMPDLNDPYHCAVVLELVAVLCIEKNHYVTYVKTNNINGKWIYFNSMEKMENGFFIPVVRETKLHEYFAKTPADKKNYEYDRDVNKIEEYAFVCIYKNPTLEIYSKDFNSD